jgi:benzoate/toluate 1,2-dioxygenase beta subunit
VQRQIENFLHVEARLLDQQKWQEWNSLFTEDGYYWVPLEHDQTNPHDHVSLYYENAVMREVRMRRLVEPRAWSQMPTTRTARIVGNIIIDEDGSDARTVRVNSTFHMTEWRKGQEMRITGGTYEHHLEKFGDAWKIRLKRVNIINCDGIHDPFEVFI